MVIQQVTIHEEDIKALLKQHQNTTTTLPKTNLLLYLNIVDDFILESNQTIGDEGREYAINAIVIDIITHEYHKYCDLLNIPANWREDVHQMLDIIRQGGRKFAQLSSLIILYFIHATPDSMLTYEELPNLVANSSRNIMRIRALGIKIIQDCLIQAEIDSRRRSLDRRLRQSLPNRGYGSIVERENELNDVKNIIFENKNVLIKGAYGVGKSLLVEKVVDSLISHIQTESAILWLDAQKSNDLELSIRAYFPKTDFEVLKNYLAHIATIIIIDNPSYSDIVYLDRHFPLAKLIAISENMIYEAHFWHYTYHLKALSPTSSERLIQHIMSRYNDIQLDNRLASDIIKSSKGIPKYIIEAVSNYCNDHVEVSNEIDCYLALTKHTWLSINAIIDFWVPEISLEDVTNHPTIEVVMIDGQSYARLRDHVVTQYDQDVLEKIYKIVYRNRLLNTPIFPDVIYGLMQNRLDVDDDWLHYALEQYSDKLNGWTSWLEFAANVTHDLGVYSDVIVRLSRYYRQIGQPNKYFADLEKLKTHSAQIEVIHCLRASSQYTLAFARLEKLINAKKSFSPAQNNLLLLKAQICIDVGNYDYAEILLKQIQSNDIAYQLVQGQLSAMQGHASIDLFRDYETGDHQADSYHHYLIACQNYAENPQVALQYFLKGLQIINRQPISNKLIVGRYLYNIGACYIRLDYLKEAKMYLQEAFNIQQAIGDKLGLIYTEKSLSDLT
jgi:tetratricopeptide (TPR) repeat protein